MNNNNEGFTKTVTNAFGENESLWLRINEVKIQFHGNETRVLVRGFASESAFNSGGKFKYEKMHAIEDIDPTGNILSQVNEKLEELY